MPSLRERFTALLLGNEQRRLVSAIDALAEARRYVRAPGNSRLEEVDGQLVDLVLEQSGYSRIGGAGSFQPLDRMFSEQARRSAVTQARWMHHYDVLTARAVEMWTDFGFGQHVTVTPKDPKLKAIFTDFWKAPRNRAVLGDAKIHENSQRVLVDGEFFLAVWVSTLDGQCTVRRLATEAISAIHCDPDDPETPLWYVQTTPEGDVWFPDWRATPDDLTRVQPPAGALDAQALRTATRVVIIPVQRNCIGGRGWPQLTQALVWARAYKEFIGDRATIAKKAAMFVEKLKVKNAGQRQIDNIVGRLQSSLVNSGQGLDRNANTAAGQTWVENDNADLQWMSRDTGAAAAQTDGLTIAAQFAAGASVPLHWLGRADAMQNRAVAKESSLPWYEQVQRYQTFWSATFSDLCEVVGRMANEHSQAGIEDFSCEVGMDSPFQNDIDEIGALMGAISAAAGSGGLDSLIASRAITELTRLGLQSLGLRDAEAVFAPAGIIGAPDGGSVIGAPNGGGVIGGAGSGVIGARGAGAGVIGSSGNGSVIGSLPAEYAELVQQGRLAEALERARAALAAGPEMEIDDVKAQEFFTRLERMLVAGQGGGGRPLILVEGADGRLERVREQADERPVIVNLSVPEQPAPVVHVSVPAPVVNVAAPEQKPVPAPVVNVTLPESAHESDNSPAAPPPAYEIERDRQGRIVGIVPRA